MLPLVPTTKEVAMIERKELSKDEIAHRAYELMFNGAARMGRMSRTGSGRKRS